MPIPLLQIDAFTDEAFAGNPAAVCILPSAREASWMQHVAREMNLPETAFLVSRGKNEGFDLRWFTPTVEVDLCGHATLASAWLLFERLAPGLKRVDFETRSGILTVERGQGGQHVMSLPADPVEPYGAPGLAVQLGDALGTTAPAAVFKGRYAMAVWDDARIVRSLAGPGDVARLLHPHGIWGLIATAPGDNVESGDYDFVSRFFAPEKGVPEDPVTGSAHCALTPYWAKRLGKTTMRARQASPRGGDLVCVDDGARTILSGPCALYMTAEISV
jgi:PhzF family phenazine biosynthesis protein